MRLYAGPSSEFIQLNIHNKLADFLKQEFFKAYGYNPSQNEVMSWRNSLFRVAILLQDNNLTNNGIFVEHQLPMSSKRIDIIICGKDNDGNKNAVIIELKQWEKCTLSEYDSEYVVTWVGGGNRTVLHPSVQVGNYKYYLESNHTVFYQEESPVNLSACSYLHNYNYIDTDAIFDKRFEKAIERFPIYTADDYVELGSYLENRVSQGDGMEVLKEIEESKYRPSKKLLQHVSNVIKEKLQGKELKFLGRKEDYILLDEQLIVYDNVWSVIKKCGNDSRKYAIIIKGGPGTGKSVIALQLLANLAAENKNVQYATGSRSFTQTLRKIVGTRGTSLFKYFMSYGEAQPNEIDVLILDESHRIRDKTGYPFKSTGRSQVEDLIRAAKVSVFFIDDFQSVRSGEIGSFDYIKESAEKLGCKIFEHELESQFRCNGSDAFINWINNTLQIKKTANALWVPDPNFEFKIVGSPEELDSLIRSKESEGYSARMTAGFCWQWSKELAADGKLVEDVKVGSYSRPWNAPPDMQKLPKEIPKSDYWAYDPNGINQVGCIYTAQGFEFDYAGVIFGNDLKYNFDENSWIGFPENSYDSSVKKSKDQFVQLVKNTYRVLLSRGMKGCYVYFVDKETEKYFRSRIERN